MLQMANEVLALRDSMIRMCDSASRSQERVTKYRDQCKGMAENFGRKLEEAKARENDIASKLLASEVNRDEWTDRFREGESKAAIEHNRAFVAETKLAVVSASLASIETRVDELTRWFKDAKSWADTMVANARAAEGRATEAEAAVQGAEQRRVKAAAQVWDAGARAKEAESRAWGAETRAEKAEARVQEAEARAQGAIMEFRGSPEFEQEVIEASLDAYAQGFNHCKAKVAEVFGINDLDLEAIQHADLDDGETDRDEAGGESSPGEP